MVECVSDFKMPEKIVSRLLKESLPDDVTITKDAKNAACRSASIFILQLSIRAAELASNNNRNTLENQDIIGAVADLGLSEYTSQLTRFGARKSHTQYYSYINVIITLYKLLTQTIFNLNLSDIERKRNAKRRESGLPLGKGKPSKAIPVEDTQPQESVDQMDLDSCDMHADQQQESDSNIDDTHTTTLNHNNDLDKSMDDTPDHNNDQDETSDHNDHFIIDLDHNEHDHEVNDDRNTE